ncbi:MAG: cyclic-di-AMP receptor [Clostridia bacterium]|nr:cyclic-di-AMP receptor [Clostridia bacterium]
MKLVIAIVQDEDASRLVNQLMKNGFGVTKLATTGGFLRAGNTTLLIGVDDDKLSSVMEIIEKVCKSRKQLTATPSSVSAMGAMPGAASYPVEVTVGGATVFVMSVDQFVKL